MSSFHYDFILSKRSSLAKVWLAAHWEKKLSKVQIFETNLQSSVHDILHPKVPIALRTSSHLLVGLVRIYSRKAKYLLTDCSEALVNIKVAFRPALHELKKRKRAKDILDCPLFITEKVDLLDQWVPEVSNGEMDCSLNQSKIEEITIQEEPMKVSSLEDYFDDEGFGDMFDSAELTEQELGKQVYSFTDSDCVMEDGVSYDSSSVTDFSDPYLAFTPVKETNQINKLKDRILSENGCHVDVPKFALQLDEEMSEVNESPQLQHGRQIVQIEKENNPADDMEGIVLDPIVESPSKRCRKSLKRKLLIDSEISISREEIFDQISNTSRLCGTPVIAPRTKRKMKQINDVHTLFLLHSYNKPLAPCLQKMLRCSRKNNSASISSNLLEEEIAFGTNEDDEDDFDSVFIPLRDVEYSSDEEDADQKSFPAFIEDAAIEETSEQVEDISHDEFCSFVETTVLKSHPDPVNLQQVVSNGTLTRKNVARKFLKCLLMQRDARLNLHQVSHFSEIYLYLGNKHVPSLESS